MTELSPDDRRAATELAGRLLNGSVVSGFRFSPTVIVLFDPDPWSDGEIYLTIESGCAVSRAPQRQDAEELQNMEFEEMWPQLHGLARSRVANVRLGENAAHLYIEFEGGQSMSVGGSNPQYESWQLGRKGGPELLVATPGGGIAIWV